jgi:hypothetical protein
MKVACNQKKETVMTYTKALACFLLALALIVPGGVASAGRCPGDPKCKDYKPSPEKPKPPVAKPAKPKPVQSDEPECHDGAGSPQPC